MKRDESHTRVSSVWRSGESSWFSLLITEEKVYSWPCLASVLYRTHQDGHQSAVITPLFSPP